MKQSAKMLLKGLVILTFIPCQLMAQTVNLTSAAENEIMASSTPVVTSNTTVLLNRLNEIKAMEKSSLTSTEKKSLRKEVKEIKSELKATGNGVYLSVGAIIIIILLLILLL